MIVMIKSRRDGSLVDEMNTPLLSRANEGML